MLAFHFHCISFEVVIKTFAPKLFADSGESYAGIYVPTLVHTIMTMNENTQQEFINLKGFMVSPYYYRPLSSIAVKFHLVLGWKWLHRKVCRILWSLDVARYPHEVLQRPRADIRGMSHTVAA